MSTVRLVEPYSPRDIRFLDLWESSGFRVKAYAIIYQGRTLPDAKVIQAAKTLTFNRLSELGDDQHYGVGFVIIHLARRSDIVLIDWWSSENELRQVIYAAPAGEPGAFAPIAVERAFACVWELEVHNFERLAWIEHVLKRAAGPALETGLDEYLAQRFNGRV